MRERGTAARPRPTGADALACLVLASIEGRFEKKSAKIEKINSFFQILDYHFVSIDEHLRKKERKK